MSGQTFNESRIDKGISRLLLGLAVFGFFLTVMWGLKSVQQHAENVAAETEAANVEPPVYDLAH